MIRIRTKTFWIVLALLACAAFVLRLWMCAEVFRTDPSAYAPSPATDMATYRAIAKNILRGELPERFVYQPFYSAVFLPIAFLLAGPLWGVGILQSLCASGIVVFSALIAARIHSKTAGIVAAVLCLFSQMLFFYVPYALIEIQQCLWITALAWLVLRASERCRMRGWVCAGLVFSFAILSRGNAWLLLPAILWALFSSARGRIPLRRSFAFAAVFLVCAIAPQIPFAWHNSAASGSLSGPSAAGPTVLAIGNNPQGAPGGLPIPYPETYECWMSHEKEISIPKRIWNWACDEPAAFLIQQIQKVFLFWDAYEIPNNIDLQWNARGSSAFACFGIIPTGLILFFGVAGSFLILFRFRRNRKCVFLISYSLSYALATSAFYVLARFRVPILGVLSAIAAFFIASVLSAIHRRDRRMIFRLQVPAAFFSAFFVFAAYPAWRSFYEAPVMRLVRPDGVRLETPERLLILDHAPNYYDSWSACPLTASTVLTKTFAPLGLKSNDWKNAFLDVALLRDAGTPIAIECNGRRFLCLPQTPTQLSFYRLGPLQVPKDLSFRISFPDLPKASASLALDFHRNYGRTSVDGADAPCEAVMKLILQR